MKMNFVDRRSKMLERTDIENTGVLENQNKFRFLLLILTVNCPLPCKMCFNWKNNETDEIEESYLEAAIEELYKNNFFIFDASINFSGGETLLRKDVFNLIKFSRDRDLKTVLTTSGYVYNDSISEKIRDSGLDCIALPLDSLEQKKHDYLRGVEGVFQSTMNIIQDFPGKVTLTCTISSYNVDEICEIAEWAERNDNIVGLGFQALVAPFNLTVPRKNFHLRPEFNHLWPKDYDTVSTNLDKLIKFRNNSTKIYTTAKHMSFFKEYFRDPNKINREVKCRVGDYSLTILSKGDVIFCNYMEPIGNIKEANIINILTNHRAEESKQRMLDCKETCEFFVNCFFED